MRFYRLWCIDCEQSAGRSPVTVYCEHRVEVAGGFIEACTQARADGYWPLHVIESDWVSTDIFN